MKIPHVWIISAGRSGSTALMGIINGLGIVIDNVSLRTTESEHPELVKLNERILDSMFGDLVEEDRADWFIKPFPEGWREWLYADHPEFEEDINKILETIPPVIKDPRFSITLPIWWKYAKIRPDFLIRLDREDFQVAQSWILKKTESFAETMLSLKQKRLNLDLISQSFELDGTHIYRFKYPNFLLEQEELGQVLSHIFDIPLPEVMDVIKDVVVDSWIHKYKRFGEDGTEDLEAEIPENSELKVAVKFVTKPRNMTVDPGEDPVSDMLNSLDVSSGAEGGIVMEGF